MQLHIPDKLLKKYPQYTRNELRMIVKVFLNQKSYKLKTGKIVDFTMPYIGRIKSHGLKKNKGALAADRKKKKKKYAKSLMTKEKLLF